MAADPLTATGRVVVRQLTRLVGNIMSSWPRARLLGDSPRCFLVLGNDIAAIADAINGLIEI